MNPKERFDKYHEDDMDRIILLIKNGTIKSGKFAHHIKIDKDFKVKKEVLPK